MSEENKNNEEKDNATKETIKANIPDGKVLKMPLDTLIDFKYHAFKPYTGERLQRLVESIKDNGIIQPIIARPAKDKDKYEIISGHNRVAAAKSAGLAGIPAIVLEISDDEAIIMANETNISQRTFAEWGHSEKAKSIFQYHTVIKKQGARSDLQSKTFAELQEKLDAQRKTACIYGISEYTVELYLQLYRMIEPLQERLDLKEFGVTPARHISHISKESQKLISSVLNEDKKEEIYRITMTNSKELRKLDKETKLTKEKIRELLSKETQSHEDNEAEQSNSQTDDYKTISIEAGKYDQYFFGKEKSEVAEEILGAMDIKEKISELTLRYFADGELPETDVKKFIQSFEDFLQNQILMQSPKGEPEAE